jgi:hypothetical protein
LSGENAASGAFVVELTTQCQLARYAFERLREQARCDIERDFKSLKPRSNGPTEIFAHCTVFLSAAGVISKILFPTGKNRTRVTRGERLRALLEFERRDLPTLNTLGVRNAFEHIDRELDHFLESSPAELVQYHLTRHAPPKGVAVLKRFDPRSLSLSYLDTRLDLRACYSEIELVEERVSKARGRVRLSRGLRGEDPIS